MKLVIFVSMIAALLPWQVGTAQTQAPDSAITDQGKKVFTSAGYAKCHDADGSKKLADGTTLLGRLSKVKDPEARLGTRLKDAQQRHQVFLYLQPLIERERLSDTQQGSVATRLK